MLTQIGTRSSHHQFCSICVVKQIGRMDAHDWPDPMMSLRRSEGIEGAKPASTSSISSDLHFDSHISELASFSESGDTRLVIEKPPVERIRPATLLDQLGLDDQRLLSVR